MWWLFQITIMTPIIGPNGAYHWAPQRRPLHLIGAEQGSFLHGSWLGCCSIATTFSGTPGYVRANWRGHTEAYAMLHDALWFALSLVLRRQKSRSKLE
jgi:hypothetical protein